MCPTSVPHPSQPHKLTPERRPTSPASHLTGEAERKCTFFEALPPLAVPGREGVGAVRWRQHVASLSAVEVGTMGVEVGTGGVRVHGEQGLDLTFWGGERG